MQLIKNLSGRKIVLFIGILYTVLITIVLLLPARGLPQFNIPNLDKLVHVMLHGVLIFIWLTYVYLGDRYHFLSKMVVIALVLCFFYGIVIEAFQHWFTATRSFDLFDIAANGIGDLTGLLSFRIVRKKIIRGS
jgi:VanZ family protein